MTLEQFMREASDRVESIFAIRGELVAMVDAVDRNGERHIIALPIPEGGKDRAIALLRAELELRDIVRFVLMTEAWAVHAKPDAVEHATKLANESRLEEHPDRVEIVAFTAEDEKEGVLVGRRLIIRGAVRPHLGPLEIDNPTEITEHAGRMIGLLPRRGKVQ